MRPTESQYSTDTKLKRIAWLSSMDPQKEYACLMHHFNEESLTQCFQELDGRKATGIDRVSKEQYNQNLTENIRNLLQRMQKMAYRPQAVREVRIPKEGKPGATRPLGISNLEDKIVQSMMKKILESIYDPAFCEGSYGCRPGKGPHDAIKDLQDYLHNNYIEVVIDMDLENFFGTIDHSILLEILKERINDFRLIRYISRMFKAGVLSKGELRMSNEGVPQGSICSPVLANIFAHRVIDEWVCDIIKPYLRKEVRLFRYMDDTIICCKSREDSEKILRVLGKRLEKFKLKLNEEKTKAVSFSKNKARAGQKQGVFDFLGFTFFLGKSRVGFITPKLKTSQKRYRSKLKNIKEWIKANRHETKLVPFWKKFCAKVRGHGQYYGVSHNFIQVSRFFYEAEHIFFKWVNRRSQKKSFDWSKFLIFKNKYPPPKPRIVHKLFWEDNR